ncbi:MAG: hypothetical protein ACI867_000663 [Glaciecola sp.]|jgi:uncharacterized protein YbjT (DUF2867 family)
MKVLITGASGYIGGRLVPELLAQGHDVRCLARTPSKLDDNDWREQVEVVQGDVSDPISTRASLEGIDAAYYLVHSIGEGPDWETFESTCATVFRDACDDAGVGQIIYLGGLGQDDEELSAHLTSRHVVGDILGAGATPCTELRAAIIIGSGSASFEMLRNLVDVLPAMVTPKWVSSPCQPIAVRDVLYYLSGVLGLPEAANRTFEVGGPQVRTYGEMMQEYAQVAGLRRRLIITIPLLTPRLSSLWVGLVTPLPPSLARPLIDSLVNDVTVHDDSIKEVLPHTPMPYAEAVSLALRRVADLDVRTSWRDADVTPADPLPSDPDWAGGTVLADDRTITVDAPIEDVFAVVTGLGGARGWFSFNWLWFARGLVDLLLGGIGPRRGRRHPDDLGVGDVVDFFRVEALEEPVLLRLRGEMKMPGDAWLEFNIEPDGPTRSILRQRARFHPRGLVGRLYWYSLLPFHAVIFAQMQRRMAEAAVARAHSDSAVSHP